MVLTQRRRGAEAQGGIRINTIYEVTESRPSTRRLRDGSIVVHNAEPPKGGTTYLKFQRAAEAWSVSATEVAFVRSTTVVVFSAGKFSAFARGELARRLKTKSSSYVGLSSFPERR